MQIWITKYALTTGILEVEARNIQGTDNAIAYRQPGAVFDEYAHREGHGWHRSRHSAVCRAERMRAAKIASLRKSIAKLEKLSFA